MGMLEYQIECIGSDNVTFIDLMTTILQTEARRKPTFPTTTVTENLVNVAGEAISLTDTVTTTSGSQPYEYGPTSPQPRYGFAVYS